MAPYSTVAPPEEEQLAPPGKAPAPKKRLPSLHWDRTRPAQPLFRDSLLELSNTRPKRRVLDFVASVFLHTMLISVLILIPLYFTEAIDLKQFTQTMLVAPPPPPPPPPAAPAIAKISRAPRRVFTSGGKLLAPVAIPSKIAMIKEEELPPDVGAGVVGGVPGGVPGGQMGGVIGGIISGAQRTYIPIAPTVAPRAPLRIGGRVKPPRVVSNPEPVYPPIARQARIQGDVRIDAVIDAEGNVIEMQVVSGHPLLIPAATEALRKWKYEPTYLNEQPVSVQLIVTITFRLN